MHPHLPGDVREHLVAVLELDTEHGVRQRLDHRSFNEDRVVFGLGDRRHLPHIWRAKKDARTHRESTRQDTRHARSPAIGRFGQTGHGAGRADSEEVNALPGNCFPACATWSSAGASGGPHGRADL